MNLEEIRTEIDALDKELLALFERRMDLCRDVALYKKEHNLPVFQPEREEKLLDEFDSGMTTSAIAKEHGRSRGAIESRLADLGKIADTYFNRKPR